MRESHQVRSENPGARQPLQPVLKIAHPCHPELFTKPVGQRLTECTSLRNMLKNSQSRLGKPVSVGCLIPGVRESDIDFL